MKTTPVPTLFNHLLCYVPLPQSDVPTSRTVQVRGHGGQLCIVFVWLDRCGCLDWSLPQGFQKHHSSSRKTRMQCDSVLRPSNFEIRQLCTAPQCSSSTLVVPQKIYKNLLFIYFKNLIENTCLGIGKSHTGNMAS